MAAFDPNMVAMINAILKDSSEDVGALTKWNQILRILFEYRIPYKRMVKLCELLVHPKNRGGLGLNAHDAHEILAKVKRVGADLEHLRKACAFEMSPLGVVRQSQIDFNKKLVASSQGLLAPVTGEERLLTVACSHFSAGCRAAVAGCKTNEQSLQGPDNTINLQALCTGDKNKVFTEIIANGFEFLIIPATVEQEFGPPIADLAQKALNTEHGTFSQANELQVMSSMALAAESAGGAPDWQSVINQAKAAMPPCSSYLHVLAEFVKNYAGGDGSPILKSLFSKITKHVSVLVSSLRGQT